MSPQPLPIGRRDLVAMRERALRVRRARGPSRGPVRMRLWAPTTAIFLLLAPFALLLLPLLLLAPRRLAPRPLSALLGVGALLMSLGGTQVDVDTPRARIRIHLI